MLRFHRSERPLLGKADIQQTALESPQIRLARTAGLAPEPALEVNAAIEFFAQRENAVIMDVRTPVEYEMSHITGSVNVNVQLEGSYVAWKDAELPLTEQSN